MKSTKNIVKVFYTEYDAYFTIIYSDGSSEQSPYIRRPELKENAESVQAFRFDACMINRLFQYS